MTVIHNAYILVTGDTYSRRGTGQTDLPQLSDALVNEDWDSCNVSIWSRGNKHRVCNLFQ
jgi:hypothetical protein